MKRNHTWDVLDLPKNKKPVGSKWVFKIMYHINGELERHKVFLVTKGFTQTYREDYKDTFAHLVKIYTVRVVLFLATNLSWDLWLMDVKNAFLHGEIKEKVYMLPPPSLEVEEDKFFKLNKAIYGVKLSPCSWYYKLSKTFRGESLKCQKLIIRFSNSKGNMYCRCPYIF